MEHEVWVVDNASVDDSVEWVKAQYPEVKLIANEHNLGFSKANNQAIRKSQSEYVILLNPDTVVEEDSLRACIDFMDSHPDAGALGIRMIDGSGTFLPESKRGLPTPWVAACKTLRLHKLFPSVKAFNGYYLSYLDERENHAVDVLSGAFMLLRRSVLDEVGLLDEDYFMYGEDVDLSYRITKAGYRNYYYAGSSIIHYKGESTKKGSLNYIVTFYKAMILFAQKHYSKQQAGLYSLLIKAAILIHGTASFIKSKLIKFLLPLLDAVGILGSLYALSNFWEVYRYGDADYFSSTAYYINLPVYTAVWLLSLWLAGAYDRHKHIFKILRGVAIGLLILLSAYGLVSLEYRHSRMVLLLGAVSTAFVVLVWRLLLWNMGGRLEGLSPKRNRRLAVVGKEEEVTRVTGLIQNLMKNPVDIIKVSPQSQQGNYFRMSLADLDSAMDKSRIDEVIFCSKDVPASVITKWMSKIGTKSRVKIVADQSTSIIGSPSKNSRGELYTVELSFNILEPQHQRNKWLFDKLSSLLMIVLFPLGLAFSRKRAKYLPRSLQVLLGRRSWVGLDHRDQEWQTLPSIKDGVFTPVWEEVDVAAVHGHNLSYCRDYLWTEDLNLVIRQI